MRGRRVELRRHRRRRPATTASPAPPTSPAPGLSVCVLERRDIARRRLRDRGGLAGPARLARLVRGLDAPAEGRSRPASCADFGYEAVPLDPSYATFGADGRPIFFFNDAARPRPRSRATRSGRRRVPGFEALLARARGSCARCCCARLPRSAPKRPATCSPCCARPAAPPASPARRARAVPGHDDVGRRPARRVVRDRRPQGRHRPRPAWSACGPDPRTPGHRLQPAAPRARRAERGAGRVGTRQGRHGRHQPGARAQRRGRRRHDPHRRRRPLDRRDAAAAPRASRSTSGEELRAPLVVSGAHPRTTVLDLVGAEHFPDEVVQRHAPLPQPRRLGEDQLHPLRAAALRRSRPRTASGCCAPASRSARRSTTSSAPGRTPSAASRPAGPYVEVEVPSSVDPSLTDDGTA